MPKSLLETKLEAMRLIKSLISEFNLPVQILDASLVLETLTSKKPEYGSLANANLFVNHILETGETSKHWTILLDEWLEEATPEIMFTLTNTDPGYWKPFSCTGKEFETICELIEEMGEETEDQVLIQAMIRRLYT